MRLRLSLLLLTLILTGCVKHHRTVVIVHHKPLASATQAKAMPSFNRVDVRGQINVDVHTGYKKPEIVLHGDPRDLAQVQLFVRNNQLNMSLGKGYPRFGSVSAVIKTRQLNYLKYVGSGRLRGEHLVSNNLTLYINNSGRTTLGGQLEIYSLDALGTGTTQITGVNSRVMAVRLGEHARVQLAGKVNLSNINLDGNGWFALYWVKSDWLKIRAKGRSTLLLAGVANKLDVELWDRACFKGRYLRAKSTFVKTHGNSTAQVSSVEKQHSLATDNSNIYYYNIPDSRADFMAYNGSVLDMREWSQYALRDYDRYNTQIP